MEKNKNSKYNPLEKTEIIDKTFGSPYKCPLCEERGEWLVITEHINACALESCKNDFSLSISALLTINEYISAKNGFVVLKKYLENLIYYYNDKKYQTIRLNNKMFVQNIQPLIGHENVMRYIGFSLQNILIGEVFEACYIIENPDINHLNHCLDMLNAENRIIPQFCRKYKKYFIQSNCEKFKDDDDSLFNTHAVDLIEETKRRNKEAMDQEVLRFRTSSTAVSPMVKMKILFPDSSVLETSFNITENTSSIYSFILQHLCDWDHPFILQANQAIIPVNRLPGHSKLFLVLCCRDKTIESLDIRDSIALHFKLMFHQMPTIFLNNYSADI
ncbi:hypothetical protein HZS_4004 [Henneguya salminicola]|nr:hypothetical protein HZS_4004 [Henneguya salminicola]